MTHAIQRRITMRVLSPGAVTLVSRKGAVVHFEAQGFMDIDAKQPMQKDSVFGLASMTKPITATAILMLMEQGKLRLNDPVSRFIPEFKNVNKVRVFGSQALLSGSARGEQEDPADQTQDPGSRAGAAQPRDNRSRSADTYLRADEHRGDESGSPATVGHAIEHLGNTGSSLRASA